MDDKLLFGDPHPSLSESGDAIDVRIRELSHNARWRELYEGANKKLLRKFIGNDMENPELYEVLCRFANQALASGITHLSMKLLYARARWYADCETEGEEFKLNDHYRSLYARKLICEYPEKFDGFFVLRRLGARTNRLLESSEK